MDLWVVAAAAGAGYVAKNLPNFSADKKEGSLGGNSLKYSNNLQPESRNFLQQLRDKTCPLRRLARKTAQDDAFSDVKLSEIDRPISREREASAVSVNGDDYVKTEILEGRYNKGLIPNFSEVESQQYGDGEKKNLGRINGGKTVRNRRCRVHSTRPLSLVESQSLHPSKSALGPVLVTDSAWEEAKPDNKSPSPSLQQSSSGDGATSGRSSRSQGAEVLLFISGMTVGILTASTSWKNEVEKLNMQLNQMQSLVEDLHEELDMKEMLMVKELDDERDSEEDTPLSSLSKLNEFKANDKKAENLELLSRIEAELQAELEMLELNIKTSEMEKIYSVVEVDSDFEPEIVEGDLKATMVKDDVSESESRTTDTRSDSSKPANYAVSPWELSLRLHELIEFRLETRIKELETALSHSEDRVGVHHGIVSGRRLSYSHSHTCICDEHDKREDEPSSSNSFSNRTQNGDHDLISHHGVITGEDGSPQDMQILMSRSSDEDSMSEDEGSDDSELLLIKQILERRKSGSSFNFKIE